MKKLSKVFRAAVIGIGPMGRNHVRVIREHPGFELAALVDSDTDILQALNGDGVELHTAIDELNCDDIDCAVLSTPTVTHAELAIDLINKGVALLIEKPIARSFSEALEIQSALRGSPVCVGVGHVERHNPVVARLSEVIKSGNLGDAIHVSATRVGGAPTQVEKAENVLFDLAVHDIDVLQQLFGKMEVIAAVCHASVAQGVYDTAEILLKQARGVTASVHVNWITPTKIRSVRVTGTRGVCFTDYILQTCNMTGGNILAPQADKFTTFRDHLQYYQSSDKIEFAVAREEPLVRQLNEFYKAMMGEPSGICTVDQAVEVVQLTEEALDKSEKVNSSRS